MSRIISEHFRQDGAAKVKYPSITQAKAAGERYAQHAYHCKFCGEYHTGGHKPRNGTRRSTAPVKLPPRTQPVGPTIIAQPSFWERLRNRVRGWL